MGLRGPQPDPVVTTRRPTVDLHLKNISPEAIRIYRAMRRLEKKQGGPGGPEWWSKSKQLAACFNLFPGQWVYQDPSWKTDSRPCEFLHKQFATLEAALKQANKKRTSKFKWQLLKAV